MVKFCIIFFSLLIVSTLYSSQVYISLGSKLPKTNSKTACFLLKDQIWSFPNARDSEYYAKRAFFYNVGALLFQMRRAMAGATFVTLMQYYGDTKYLESEYLHHPVDAADHLLIEQSGRSYPLMFPLAQTILRLDPQFEPAAIYAGSVLVWNLNRSEQGVEIFKQALEHNPHSWQLHLLLAAMIYKQRGQFEEMISLLEQSAQDKNSPFLLKSILANIYKVRGQYEKAITLWQLALNQKNLRESDIDRAKNQIQELSNLMQK